MEKTCFLLAMCCSAALFLAKGCFGQTDACFAFVLRGDVAMTVLRYAADRGAGLIACGRHSYTFVQRVLLGSVSTSIIRRASCSVLVVPDEGGDASIEVVTQLTGSRESTEKGDWPALLQSFTKRNTGRGTRLDVEPASPGGAVSVEQGYLLLGVDFDPHDDRADIMLGDPETMRNHLTHRIAGLRAITEITDCHGRNSALRFDSMNGRYTLTLSDSNGLP